jgi:hypothetical protein
MQNITIRVHSFLNSNWRVKAKSNVSSTETACPVNSLYMVRTMVFVDGHTPSDKR